MATKRKSTKAKPASKGKTSQGKSRPKSTRPKAAKQPEEARGEDHSESEIRFDQSELKDAQRRSSIQIGMEVIGLDGERVGQVMEVRGDEFLVQRSLGRDVYVPFSSCQEIAENQVILSVAANAVDSQGWAYPDLLSLPFSTPS